MKTSLLTKLAILLLITSTLSGCIWAIEDDGYRSGAGRNNHGGGGGGHGGDHHDGH